MENSCNETFFNDLTVRICSAASNRVFCGNFSFLLDFRLEVRSLGGVLEFGFVRGD
jgi:hypothetical protein